MWSPMKCAIDTEVRPYLLNLLLSKRNVLHDAKCMLTDKSVSDDLVAVVEKRPVGSALFASVFPLYTRTAGEVQRHT